MSYNKQKIKEVFNNPEFQRLIENEDWEALIRKGYFDNFRHQNNLASFIIQKLNYPLFEEIDIIPAGCFCGDKNIQGDFIIPSSVKIIEDSAFMNCHSLRNITIPSSVTSIDDGVFYGCENLTSITILSSVTRIKIGAFLRCISLKDVYYKGTREQFEDIVEPFGNDYLLFNANFHQI